MGVAFAPNKTYAKLIVDSYAVLPCTVALERFEAVGRRNTQIGQALRSVKHGQLAHGNLLDVDPATNPLAFKQASRGGAGECPYHAKNSNA